MIVGMQSTWYNPSVVRHATAITNSLAQMCDLAVTKVHAPATWMLH